MAFTDPIATTNTPFTTKVTEHSLAPSPYFTWSTSKPRPTNSWWQNLIIPDYDSGTYNGKTHTYPYGQWPQTDGKGYIVTYFGDQDGDRSVAEQSITLSGAQDISIGVNEAITTRAITDYSDLGVTLQFNTASGTMTTYFCEGMAFNNAVYSGATPVVTIQGAILAINDVSPSTATLSNVTKLKITTNRYNRNWFIYASSPISFTLSGQSLIATSSYNGFLQIAVETDDSQEAIYDIASTAVLTGGSLDATFSGDTANMVFTFTTLGSGAPLVFAMPHHQDILTGATYTGLQLPSLRGVLKAVRASTWTLTEPLSTITWNAPRTLPAGTYGDIEAALTIERNTTNDAVGGGWGLSPYYYGKYIAKMARLILIAQSVNDTATANTIATRLKSEISSYLTATPTGTAGVNGSGYRNCLLYQGGSTWKGISTENGFSDMGADFGSGRFNDHHFHYGYWIYAAAVLAKDDATWASNNAAAIESLIRDIANPSLGDTYFPKFRYKDWFSGHSWASGLVGLDVGPDQESTSEAINAWYGIQLWGLARNNTNIMNLGRLLLATEVRSAQKYWHIPSATSDIYPAPFSDNGTAVSVRTHKVAVETFFGSLPHYFYGIQSLPYTPVTELYMDTTWATRCYPLASVDIPVAPTSNPQDTGWNSVIYGLHAAADPDAGYIDAQSIDLTQISDFTTYTQYGRDLDNGLSKADLLYWAATRPGFSGASDSGGGTGTPSGSISSNKSQQRYLAYGYYGNPITMNRQAISSNYTATKNDYLLGVTALTGSLTVTLPEQNLVGQILIIKDETGQASNTKSITIQGTIDQQSDIVITVAYGIIRLYNNGISWSRIS